MSRSFFNSRAHVRLQLLLLTFVAAATGAGAQAPLTNIADIRSLPREVASRHLPVTVTGIVTIGSTVSNDFFFIQSEAGRGTRVEVTVPLNLEAGEQPPAA